MRYGILFLATLFVASGAAAKGFATLDLTGVGSAAAAALGPGHAVRAEPRRLILLCETCAGEPVIDISIGNQTDGTEGRVRSSATSISDLELICRARNADCRVSALEVEPAVGWVSAYPLGETAGATAVIIREGDMLIVRSLAQDLVAARRGIDRLLPVLRDRIIGP